MTKIRLNTQVQGVAPAGSTIDADLYKYSIVRTVDGSGNMTVALKNYLGQNPSVAVPVKVQIGDTIRTITNILSVTENSGLNLSNLGSAELATKEVDLFLYLIWNNNSVGIGFARFPNAVTANDFSPVINNEKFSGLNYNNSGNNGPVVNIGRFNAILSAGPGYTWSIPATSVIINRPIYETRWLDYIPNIANSTMTWTQSIARALYKISGDTIFINIQDNYSNIGGTVERKMHFKIPFTCAQSPCSGNLLENGNYIYAIMCRIDPTLIEIYKQDNFTLNQGGVVRISGNAKI